MRFVLDFDGVICNSIRECAVTSWFAYSENRDNLLFEDILGSKIFKDYESFFNKRRGLVGPAWQYYCLFRAIYDVGSDCARLESFFYKYVHEFTNQRVLLSDKFFGTRTKLKKLNLPFWYELNHPFKEVVDGLRRIPQFRWYVSTMKDAESVMQLMEYFGVKVDPGHVIDNSYGSNKSDHIREILNRSGLHKNDIFFVDDNPVHLNEVSEILTNVYWASWGYSRQDNSQFMHLSQAALKEMLLNE